MIKKTLILVWLVCFYGVNLFCAAGTLDTTFNSGGVEAGTRSLTIDNEVFSESTAVAVQADGKIILVGQISDEATFTQFAVARFNPDGSLDTTTFNPGAVGSQAGTVVTDINNFRNSSAYGVVIQTDGKIVVSGRTFDSISGINYFALARFNTDGSLDTTFNPGGAQPGTAITTIENQDVGYPYAHVALQSDGKIVITGAGLAATEAFALARFNTNGTLDTSFNPFPAVQPGTLYYSIPGTTTSHSYDLRIQSDGKIVVAGDADGTSFAIVRFNTDGSVDTTFNGTGYNITKVNNLDAAAYGVALQQDGRAVLVGELIPAGNLAAIARFNADGTLDTTFKPTGTTQPGTGTTTIDGMTTSFGYYVVIQPNGKIIMAGGLYNTPGFGNDLMGLVRFNTDGSLDSTFNPLGTQPGTVTTTIDNQDGGQGWYVALQSDSKILLTGPMSDAADLGQVFAVARFLGGAGIINVCSSPAP